MTKKQSTTTHSLCFPPLASLLLFSSHPHIKKNYKMDVLFLPSSLSPPLFTHRHHPPLTSSVVLVLLFCCLVSSSFFAVCPLLRFWLCSKHTRNWTPPTSTLLFFWLPSHPLIQWFSSSTSPKTAFVIVVVPVVLIVCTHSSNRKIPIAFLMSPPTTVQQGRKSRPKTPLRHLRNKFQGE